jgi:hypothetical protein
MVDRTTKGRMSMTVVDADTQKVVTGGKHHDWKGETLAQAQAINVKLGDAIKAAATGPLFSSDFSPGADGKTYEVHFNVHSYYEDTGEVESTLNFVKNDLDSVEVALFAGLFESLK